MAKVIASEAVYGFISWLSTREEEVKIGSSQSVVPIIELADRWIEANRLSPP